YRAFGVPAGVPVVAHCARDDDDDGVSARRLPPELVFGVQRQRVLSIHVCVRIRLAGVLLAVLGRVLAGVIRWPRGAYGAAAPGGSSSSASARCGSGTSGARVASPLGVGLAPLSRSFLGDVRHCDWRLGEAMMAPSVAVVARSSPSHRGS